VIHENYRNYITVHTCFEMIILIDSPSEPCIRAKHVLDYRSLMPKFAFLNLI